MKLTFFYSILLCRARELACVLAQLENEKGREQQQNQSAFLKESFSHFPSFFSKADQYAKLFIRTVEA